MNKKQVAVLAAALKVEVRHGRRFGRVVRILGAELEATRARLAAGYEGATLQEALEARERELVHALVAVRDLVHGDRQLEDWAFMEAAAAAAAAAKRDVRAPADDQEGV